MQVLALEVLHQGQGRRLLPVRLGEKAGDFPQARQPGGPQPPLAGHQLPAAGGLPDGEGLQNAVAADGRRQLLQGGLVKMVPGLARVGHDAVNGQQRHPGPLGPQYHKITSSGGRPPCPSGGKGASFLPE